MDNKYQDLHIYNWKEHYPCIIRKIEIKQIIFTETEIIIDFIKGSIPRQMILSKMTTSITID